MLIKYVIFPILVFFIIPFLVMKNYETWKKVEKFTPIKAEPKKIELKAERKTSLLETPKKTESIQSYIFISEKNIFSPERKEFPIVIKPQEPGLGIKKPNPRPQVILYGITILGDYQTASIAQVGRPLYKGERETITLKLGDKIGDYKLSKVMPDRILLEAPEDSFEVLLYDPKSPKKRPTIVTPVKPATVTSVTGGSGPPTPSAPITPPPPELQKYISSREMEKQIEFPPEKISPPVSLPQPPAPLPSPLEQRRRRIISPPSAPIQEPIRTGNGGGQ
jgi:hypothetical protein